MSIVRSNSEVVIIYPDYLSAVCTVWSDAAGAQGAALPVLPEFNRSLLGGELPTNRKWVSSPQL